jgi:hypothetical protein
MDKMVKVKVGLRCREEECDCEKTTIQYGASKKGPWQEIEACDYVYVEVLEESRFVGRSDIVGVLELTLNEFQEKYISFYPEKGWQDPTA